MDRNEQEFLVQKIRTQYTEKEYTELDELKKLDAKVKKPVVTFAYVFGTLSALIMGSGMSLVMTDVGSKLGIEDGLVSGIIIGCVGMIMALINYPIYKKRLGERRRKYAEEIIALSDKLMNS